MAVTSHAPHDLHAAAQAEAVLSAQQLRTGDPKRVKHVAQLFFTQPYQDIFAHLLECQEPGCASARRQVLEALTGPDTLVQFLAQQVRLLRDVGDTLKTYSQRGKSLHHALHQIRRKITPFAY